MQTNYIIPARSSVHTLTDFQEVIYGYYRDYGRTFAWRETTDPYYIVVSEIMLQQTQTDRVIDKYQEFITVFPTILHLAQAQFKDVLRIWQGLGYNRRALYLHNFAQKIVADFSGEIPADPEILKQFKGIGPNTAGAICAFAFNKPLVFIETNIRSIFIHFFFQNQEKITDADILPLIAKTVDKENPRLWYYALMDYGVMLKKQLINPSRKSVHYTKQSKFENSDRQIRGNILKLLTQHEKLSNNQLILYLNKEKKRVNLILEQLVKEQLIILHDKKYRIA